MKKSKQVYDTMMAKDYFSQWLNIELVEISENLCKLKMLVRTDMLNGFEIIHGGVLYALADSAMAFAGCSQNVLSVTLEAGIHYHHSAKVNEHLIATTDLISQTSKFSVFRVSIHNQAGLLMATYTGTMYHTSKKILE